MERLTAADLSMVWPEDFGWPEDIGAIAILDGSSLLDSNGQVAIEGLRARIGGRLHLLPRFRQVLHMPRMGLGWPLWVDARSIDLTRHVGVVPLGRPADDARLLAACEDLFHQPLDRTLPLWRMWFLSGLPDQRVALFVKLHHAIADGVAGVAAIGAFLDFVPDALPPTPPPWTPRPVPTGSALFADNVRRRLSELGGAISKVLHPIDTTRQLRRAWPALRETFAQGPAPRTSLNRPIGRHRRLAIVRSSLGTFKEIAHAQGASVNDVLLAAVTGGVRELLRARGEDVTGLVLRAFVPVSLHPGQAGPARGNHDASLLVPLPVGEEDSMRRLRWIAAETAARKKIHRPAGGTLFRTVLIQKAFLHYAARQRFLNVYVANVPGPPVPLYLGGAPVREVFPVVPLMGNMTLGVGALSYAGQFNITTVADRETCPDVGVFVEGMRSSLDELAHAHEAGGGTSRTREATTHVA